MNLVIPSRTLKSISGITGSFTSLIDSCPAGLCFQVMEGDGDAEAVRLKVQRTPLPQWDGIVVPSAVGLKNLGNTCFINTALQCLLHTPHLLPAVLPREEMEELEAVLKARKERQQTEAASAVMSAKVWGPF